MILRMTLRWLMAAALLVGAAVLSSHLSAAVSAAMALPYDAPAKQHDSLMAAIDAAVATVFFFSGVILMLFNIRLHRRAWKSS